MEIKLNAFVERWIDVDDAKFLIKELDYAEMVSSALRPLTSSKFSIDLAELTNKLFDRGVLDWKNLTVDGKLLPYTDSIKEKMPFDLKSKVVNLMRTESQISEIEKKS